MTTFRTPLQQIVDFVLLLSIIIHSIHHLYLYTYRRLVSGFHPRDPLDTRSSKFARGLVIGIGIRVTSSTCRIAPPPGGTEACPLYHSSSAPLTST
jgi:hypothetical protein